MDDEAAQQQHMAGNHHPGGGPPPDPEGKTPVLIRSSRGEEALPMKGSPSREFYGSPGAGGGVVVEGGGEGGSTRRTPLSRSLSGPQEGKAAHAHAGTPRSHQSHHHHHHHHHRDRPPTKVMMRQDSGGQGAPPPSSTQQQQQQQHHHPHFHHHRSSRHHSQGKDHHNSSYTSPQRSPRSMSVTDSPTAEESHREHPHHPLTKSSYSLDHPHHANQSTPPTKPHQNTPLTSSGSSSASSKRNVAVTDLDQAMQERDESRLRTLFGDSGLASQANVSFGYTPGLAPEFEGGDDFVNETNLDDDPVNVKYMTSIHHGMAGRNNAFGARDHNNAAGGQEEKFHDCQEVEEDSRGKCGHSSSSADENVRYPMDMPPTLHFNQSDVFDGQLLLQWLSSQFDASHYLSLILTKQDVAVLMSQFCTHLLAAGVLSQLQGQSSLREPSFKILFVKGRAMPKP
ncbi:hypothetical protein ACOMHN_057650 [Nucella lapillus]